MTVKLGMNHSKKRRVSAGVPQGSVFGTYVFNIATEDLEDGLVHETADLDEPDISFLETALLSQNAQSTPLRNITQPDLDHSPINVDPNTFVLRPNTVNVPHRLKRRIEPTWMNKELSVRKFVDDNLQIEKLDMMSQQTYNNGDKDFKNPRVQKSEDLFKHISSNAKSKGLLVNSKKTNLLAILASKCYEAKAHFYNDNNERIDSANSLKALGFTFNQRGDCSTQVNNLFTKFRQKVWSIRRLRKSGFTEKELVSLYTSYIRPTLEYSAPIYHYDIERTRKPTRKAAVLCVKECLWF